MNLCLLIVEKQIDSHCLRQLKYEYIHRDRMSNDIFQDARVAKSIMTDLVGDENNKDIKGYIQELSMDPFGFLLISDLQVSEILVDYMISIIQ